MGYHELLVLSHASLSTHNKYVWFCMFMVMLVCHSCTCILCFVLSSFLGWRAHESIINYALISVDCNYYKCMFSPLLELSLWMLWIGFAAMMVNGQTNGTLRLTGFESSRLAGRLEVHFLGNWYTICNDFFTLREAAVVCRQLGLGYPVRIFNQDTDGPNKMTTSDSPVSRLVICNYGLWLMWFCVTKNVMWSTFNQTGLVLAVAFMPWMMWAALGKSLTSLAARIHLERTTVLHGNLWEFNVVSIYKHMYPQFACFHGMLQS